MCSSLNEYVHSKNIRKLTLLKVFRLTHVFLHETNLDGFRLIKIVFEYEEIRKLNEMYSLMYNIYSLLY